MTIFGASSLHPKIPFPAASVEREVGPHCTRIPTFEPPQFGIPGPALQLFRIESERLKLPAPFCRRIAEPFDADAAGQAPFYSCFDKVGGEEGVSGGENARLDGASSGQPSSGLVLAARVALGVFGRRASLA
jgi:hypothetical protein